MFTDVLILAGGSGERLWPESTEDRPKQFIKVQGEESFLQEAIRRAFLLHIEGSIIIITRKIWVDLVVQEVFALSKRLGQKALLDKVLVLGEPCGKNTSPPIAFTCQFLLHQNRTQKPSVLMMASDHVILNNLAFAQDVQKAFVYAQKQNLVTFAIPPSRAETGYGYVEAGEVLEDGVFKVARFKEKPNLETARFYKQSGNFYWNSGLYAFEASFMLDQFKAYAPSLYALFENYTDKTEIITQSGVRVLKTSENLSKIYRDVQSISIDYAVSEKSAELVAVRASFDWDDVGSWDSFEKYVQSSANFAVEVASDNCFVQSDIPVALCGVKDLIVVIKNGQALVCKKGESNAVKDALSLLREKGF